ncbi:hypothetical protein YPPY66_3933 [Yersinia pestis PY-66]|uniref:Uncharacterized protein n=2 Tax=Yersinia pseudotuberculosis complex TaxID=1649845 RepID=A0A0U1QV68_YERP3|nr:hypothetical protein YpsIP31758_3105 [Yersinia pseudotuberculosis IP 31758]EIQ85968.1 hypothetical protein YPPY01_3559 [Yersinia pestis PY-01]EIQ86335.1 hypothetical protein YPPY02_3605 [Yersinia pestis PY-02]EIQ86445.1 hypothetical protein YPPY03_3681 [Yersinia pestis PY-03]EIQ99173.1 hypothetical protein YPPY04_3610 [Yersinia pestis PY-04]EIR00161.1 hypothetical protein YPPY05_3599 [Yersinia pestis PY-05]EIR03628.1 hypothetical protein YPPY06_3652 [Yersinia pestis PY-06]EIR14435.1 hypot
MSKDGIFPTPDKINGEHNNRFIPRDKIKLLTIAQCLYLYR